MNFPETSISDGTRVYSNLMGECCVDLQVQMCDLRYGAFKRWLRESAHQPTEQEMREMEVYIASVGGFINLRDAFHIASPSARSVEKVELKGIAKLNRVAVDKLANQDLFLAKLESRFTAMLDKHAIFKPFGYNLKKPKKSNTGETARILNLALSDLHFGTSLDPREVPYRYGFVEEARRLASIVKRTCQFKRDYRDETELVVWLGGDIIAGLIHDTVASLTLAEQVGDAVWLLRQALVILAGDFKKVTVYCSSGNHDRNVTRHQERATSGKWDSFATHIYIALKAGVAHLPNVEVNIPRTPFIEYSPFPGQRVYATHGDTCVNAGNPGKNIKVAVLEAQMLKVNAGEVARKQPTFGLFVVGHVHVGSLTMLDTADLLTNGCLIPPDPFSLSIAYTSTKNGQYLWETTQQRLVGDSRFLEVDEQTDQDASLDVLITPWSGEF